MAVVNASVINPSLMTNITVALFTLYNQRSFVSVFEMAVEEANRLYGDAVYFDVVPLSLPEVTSCMGVTTNVAHLATQYYYQSLPPGNFLMTVAPICEPAIMEILPLMTAWNAPVIAITAGSGPELRNKRKYPTYASMSAGDAIVLNSFMIAVLEKYRWTTVFLLCDANNVKVAFYGVNCNILKNTLRRSSTSKFTTDGVNFDSAVEGSSRFRDYLGRIAASARVVIVFADSSVVRSLMVEAYKQKMTEGDYVFLFLQPFKFTPVFPCFTWNLTKSDDEMAREAFRAVLFFTADVETIAKDVPTRVLGSATRPICEDRPEIPVETVTSYATIMLAAKVAHNVLRSDLSTTAPRWDGAMLIKEMTNRTYGLGSETIAFDKDAFRIPNGVMKQFKYNSGTFENVVFYRGRSRLLSLPFGQNLTWHSGHPPENEPRCGFKGNNPQCHDNNSSGSLALQVALSLLLAVVMLGFIMLYRWMKYTAANAAAQSMAIPEADLIIKARVS